MEQLQKLLEEGVIEEVFHHLKAGKEAEVWLVSHRGVPVAAKVYKTRAFRSFKNDAGYKEGRMVRNSRTQRAMDKGSAFGRQSSEDAWKSAEADALITLHAAGVSTPKPVLFYEGVLLMEAIGDAEGRMAPRLVEAEITPAQADAMYRALRAEVVKMLCLDLIHGDLSEFNILLSANGPVIIDFPQVVTAAKNSQSEFYFNRDMGNLLRFFSAIDPGVSKHANDAAEIWRAYVRRELSPRFEPSGRAPAAQQQRRHQGPRQHGRPGPQGPGRAQQNGPRVESKPQAGASPQTPGDRRQQGQPGRRDGAPGQPRRDGAPRGPKVESKPQPGSQQPRREGAPGPRDGVGGRRRPKRRF